MPTNANTFNSRVTSEALEAKFRQVFPSQGGAELGQDLFASGVIQPVIDFSSVAEGSFLAPNLQTAWDFSTVNFEINNGSQVIANNPGFWKVSVVANIYQGDSAMNSQINISDGLGSKLVWRVDGIIGSAQTENDTIATAEFVVFLRTGDSLNGLTNTNTSSLFVSARQIADLYGNLVNPLGFTFT